MLERLNEIILDFKARLDRQPTFGWAVVTSVTPLMIQYDAEPEPIAGTPAKLVSGLAVGDRVWCMRAYRRDVILGRGGGPRNKVLWSGAGYMHGSQTATLSELVSDQATGIVLVWQAFVSGAPVNRDNVHIFVPKWHVAANNGGGIQCRMAPNVSSAAYIKYVYVRDNQISGYAGNETAPKNSHVLVAVLGV